MNSIRGNKRDFYFYIVIVMALIMYLLTVRNFLPLK